MHHHLSPEMQRCIELCQSCHESCLTTTTHCLEMGGVHASLSHINILADCAATCAQSADFMLRGSDMHGRVCGVCAEACERCAADCERLAGGDEQMLSCAAICRQCAESCRTMAAVAA
jgi:hypothetical protein